jgi:DNA-binding NarL/FixJ family response regulator
MVACAASWRSFRPGDQDSSETQEGATARGTRLASFPSRYGQAADRAVCGIGVAVINDSRRARNGLGVLLSGSPGFRVVGLFASVADALWAMQREAPDVVLINVGPRASNGTEGVRMVRTHYPNMQVLALATSDDEDLIVTTLSAGSCGYLFQNTDPAKLLECIREAHEGGAPMSPEIARKVLRIIRRAVSPKADDLAALSRRELQLLRLLSHGQSYKTAAHELCISLDTVRFHVRKIYARLHVHSKSDAITKAIRTGLL